VPYCFMVAGCAVGQMASRAVGFENGAVGRVDTYIYLYVCVVVVW
jgi:hypothetical protein